MDECAGNKIAITDIACGTASVNSPSELYSLLATSKDNQCETSCFIMSAYYSIETGLRHGHANVMTAYPLDNGQIKIFDHAFPDDQNEVRCTILQQRHQLKAAYERVESASMSIDIRFTTRNGRQYACSSDTCFLADR